MKKTLNLNLTSEDALIIADIQNDFLPGGALPVEQGDQIIPALNDYADIFAKAKAKVIASRDWHPPNHISFTDQGGPWPPHCIQNTPGAAFSSALKLPKNALTIFKASDPKKEAYSVFEETGLGDSLREQGVKRIFIGGLATDYCVVSSVLDARKLGFEVVVLADATRGINVKTGDVDAAFETMNEAGAIQVTLEDFLEPETLAIPEATEEVSADKPLGKFDEKKKARMRPKGSYKRVRAERG